eukprot:377820-Ditylum_brightwellii.AAC.1
MSSVSAISLGSGLIILDGDAICFESGKLGIGFFRGLKLLERDRTYKCTEQQLKALITNPPTLCLPSPDSKGSGFVSIPTATESE